MVYLSSSHSPNITPKKAGISYVLFTAISPVLTIYSLLYLQYRQQCLTHRSSTFFVK